MSLNGRTVIFRADGGHQRGLGHLMRCLAFADGVAAAGGRAILASVSPLAEVAEQFKARGFALLDLPGVPQHDCTILAQQSADWLVIDSYDIAPEDRAQLAASTKCLAVIDDAADDGPYAADVLINPNPGVGRSDYLDQSAVSHFALGAEFVLIRSDMLAAKQQRTFKRADQLCISGGGSDPSGAAQQSLELLNQMTERLLKIRLIVGPLAQNRAAIEALANASAHHVEIVTATRAVQDHLNWADAAIVAAGTLQWEAAYLGCPFISLVIADNQARGAQAFAHAAGSISLDWRRDVDAAVFKSAIGQLLNDTSMRQAMSEKAAQLIDGQGAQRLAALLAQIV